MVFDAVVAGAGIIGSSIAWRLAQRGMRVLLLDAGRMGGEASSAGAGMLAPGGEIEERSPWNDLAMESLRLYPGFVKELEDETGQRIDFQHCGGVEIALTEAEWRALQARGLKQAALGISSCTVRVDQLRESVPLLRPDLAGALFYPDDALVDPREVMSALGRGCRKRGVEIREQVRVISIRPQAHSAGVVTSAGNFESGAAVLAAGAWSSSIQVQDVSLARSYPVRGHLIGFQLKPGSLGLIVRHQHTYLLQRAGGFTIAGTSSENVGFNRILDNRITAEIHKRAAAVLPHLERLRPEEAWLGFRPAIEADGPAIGRAGDTALWLAYGHYRNGILLAPATAARIAAGITASLEMGSFGHSGSC